MHLGSAVQRHRSAVQRHAPTPTQRVWLRRGLDQPGGKLPLFDALGQCVDPRTVRACIEQGWAEPWYPNPLKPQWMVCKLTEAGRALAMRSVVRSLHLR